MTDTIKISLDLSKIGQTLRMDIAAPICNVSTPWGEAMGRYTKPSKQQSSMAATQTKWVVRCQPGTGELEGYNVPTWIDAKLHIPNAVAGHNLEHGTSVFAAGVAALELLRIWLAKCGLPRAALDRLSIADMTIQGVTITYLFSCVDQGKTKALVDAIKVTAKTLYPDCTVYDSKNLTITIPHRNFDIVIYDKTLLKHCKWKEGTPVSSLVERKSRIVRVEANLRENFLEAEGLRTLESWRNAYVEGQYEEIFNQTVCESLCIAGKPLRHKAPRAEVYALLTPTEAEVLRGYIGGVDPRDSASVLGSTSPTKRLSELRRRIRKDVNINIDIPWKDHVKLRCFELADQLQYPGDYRPEDEHALWCFCEANWPALLEEMRQTYEWALVEATSKRAGYKV